MKRQLLLAGNWKMNMLLEEANTYVETFIKETGSKLSDYSDKVEVLLCPPYTLLYKLKGLINDTPIKLGAQNVYYEKSGAYTGEISPLMLKDVGCEYVIIGHSERRKYFHETDNVINAKIKSSLEEGLIPILCVGELLEERKAKKEYDVVRNQLIWALDGINISSFSQLVIAYEPVWAIGTGVSAEPSDAQNMSRFIRDVLSKIFDDKIALGIRILYGGSVKPDNIEGFIKQADVDGALVGGASLDAAKFAKIFEVFLNYS